MTNRICLASGSLLAISLLLTLSSGTPGQERPPISAPPATFPANPQTIQPVKLNWQKFSPQQQLLYLSAQRGNNWLKRIQRANGRFPIGFLPALNRLMEGDDYLTQAGAAFALARGSRFFADERGDAQAQQALLTLLLETKVDAKTKDVRVPTAPLVNRLAAAGLLIAAIHELPAPGKDLLEQADQLCQFIRLQQQADGSLKWADLPEVAGPQQTEGMNLYPGLALYGIIRSQHLRPAPWKIDMLRKARGHYLAWWKEHKNPHFIPWQTAAFTEAFLLTKDPVFAEAVNEMNDWLCTLQYQQLEPRRVHWQGGFMAWQDGKTLPLAPTIQSASWAMSLAEACRTARQASDVPRWKNYSQALQNALTFLTTMQYTQVNTAHYAEAYKEEILLGGFHASHQDGNLRLDYTQHALAGLVHYLQYVADLP